MDVKLEEDEAEISQVTIRSDSINACIDYPHFPVSGNTETSYLEIKTDSTYEHDYAVIQTTNNLSASYFLSEIDVNVKLEENDMGISPTVPWSSGSYVGLPKEHSHVPTISSQTTSQGQILRIFPEKTGASDGENNSIKVVYFCNAQDTISTSEGHLIKEGSWHGAPSSDIPIANVFTLCGSFEAQINPTSQVFSVSQTQTNNELPLPAENVHLASHSTAIPSALTSPATERCCNLAVSTRPRPILSDYCEPFNLPSDEDEDYSGNIRRRLQCQKTVEDKYIRQCRVSYSRHNLRNFGRCWKAPYTKCKEMGVDFNVGSGAKQKLDFNLLTNGVMVEVSEYAKEINRAHQHVIYDILEYNFDLGVENEVQYDFSSRTMSKLKDMKMNYKRTNPGWLTEVFELPDPKTMKARKYSLKWARSNLHNSVSENPTSFDICIKEEPVVDLISPPHVKTESIFTETDVTRCADETALLGPENGPNDKCTRNESDLDVIYPQHIQTETIFIQKDITMEKSLMMPTIEEALEYLYPLCKEKGLDLDVKSKFVKKEKLDLHLLTRDVMFELADFASEVCGNYKQIVCDVLDHNFDLDLQSGKTELAEDIMDALRAVLKRKTHLQGQKRCEFDKDTFLKKRHKRKNPAEISSNQKVTTASLEPKYQRLKEVTKRRRLDLMRKKKEIDMLIARESKGGNLLEVRQVEPHWVKLESIPDKIDLALCADETKQIVVTNLDQSNVKFNANKLVKECHPLSHELGLDLDVASKPAFTLCGSFEAQINPTSRVFSVSQTQTNNELPLPAENVHLASHSTAIPSALTSPATERGCNLAVSTRPRPILSDYCEPFNLPSDEDEDYNGNVRRRLQCQKTVEDKYIRQCRVSYSRHNLRNFGRFWKAPYTKCKEMGVDFNVGSGAKQKLDFHLLTNGVMFEVSEYAKEINRAHQHVIYDILEYNFDLVVGNEVQYGFSSRTMSKLRDMKMNYKRTNPGWLTEVFELPDPKTMKASKYSLKWARSNLHNSVSENPTPFNICIKEEPVVDLISPLHVKTESIFTETDVTRCADETALLGPENGPNDKCTRNESDLDVIYPQHVHTETIFIQKDITMEKSLMMPTIEEALEYLYPLCKEKGLDLDVKSKFVKKEKLDLHLLTRGVMFEMADFASEVCGNYKQIVCDVLDHNFDLDLQSGKTELAEDIIAALRAVLKRKTHLEGQKRCELDKDTFLKKRRKRKNPAEISSNQKVTTASLEPKYQRLKEVTKRRRLDLMRKNKEIDMLIARESKGGNLLEVHTYLRKNRRENGYFESQINPTSQIFSQTQTQRQNQANNLPRHGTAIPFVLTSSATASGCNVELPTSPPLPANCESLNYPSEDEDYNVKCPKTLED
ncbi:unnamed protein product [Coregonus sp. 'balchen']|nr:unnamed protein product [Coregonus sp. 'balchen']